MEVALHVTTEPTLIRCHLSRELLRQLRLDKIDTDGSIGNHLTHALSLGEIFVFWVKDHNMATADDAWEVSDMVGSVESEAMTTNLLGVIACHE